MLPSVPAQPGLPARCQHCQSKNIFLMEHELRRRLLPCDLQPDPQVVSVRPSTDRGDEDDEDDAISCESHTPGGEDPELERGDDEADRRWFTGIRSWAEGAEVVADDTLLLDDGHIKEGPREQPRVATARISVCNRCFTRRSAWCYSTRLRMSSEKELGDLFPSSTIAVMWSAINRTPSLPPGATPLESESAMRLNIIHGDVLDATRISDGPGGAEIVGTVLPDTKICGYLATEPGAQNHCLPMLEFLQIEDPEHSEYSFMETARRRDCADDLAFTAVGEIVEFIQQDLEALHGLISCMVKTLHIGPDFFRA
ncbi:hypothetical protein B0H17DRAFT_1182291 [Mycena rosella]|uniref:Uncharacterized protein n=1 Tax=Mycena rosella TaxID=1033263 RepID=A0AAD7D546_MYCRO|nr:hypothetical protein B0H17DRAFT_1182291 [Mycena rosella]